MYGLFDRDAYGLSMFFGIKFVTKKLAHVENLAITDMLRVEK